MPTIERNSASAKFISRFNNIGNRMNSDKDGMTNQNILFDNSMTLLVSFVSINSQMKARMDNNGMEAKMPPIKLLAFDTSDMITIRTADIATLMM